MSRKRNHRMQRRPADVRRWAGALLVNQVHSEEAVVQVMNATRAALVRVLEGVGTGPDVSRLGRDINVAWVRTEQIGNSAEAQRRLEAAGDAVIECCRIFKKHGRYGLTGPGRVALGEGVDVFEEIVRASSPREMSEAEDVVIAAERDIDRKMTQRRAHTE